MDFEKLRKISLSQVAAAKRADAPAVVKWAARALSEALPPVADDDPEPVLDGDLFFAGEGSTLMIIGGSPNNPNGVSFTWDQAKAWWAFVFAGGLNIGRVRSTLTPGSKVLSPDGLRAARALGVTSTEFAPEDFNPLGLEVIP
jgi:hypothetical protein